MKFGNFGIVIVAGLFFFALSTSSVLAGIIFNVAMIEARTQELITQQVDQRIAAKKAIVEAIEKIVAEHPNYPGGEKSLYADIFAALSDLQLKHLDDVDLFAAASHALGLATDKELAASELDGENKEENIPQVEAFEPAEKNFTPGGRSITLDGVGSATENSSSTAGGKPTPASPI